MVIEDLLLTKNEISQASIWRDKDDIERIHQYCIEIEERIAILATLKAIKYFAPGSELIEELEQKYVKVVENASHSKDREGFGGRLI